MNIHTANTDLLYSDSRKAHIKKEKISICEISDFLSNMIVNILCLNPERSKRELNIYIYIDKIGEKLYLIIFSG